MMFARMTTQLALTALAVAATAPAFAAPGDLFDGALSIPSHRGLIVVPRSSQRQDDDLGQRVNTNVRLLLPKANAASSPVKPNVGAPPYAGYPFETPASLACIYGLATPVAGCNPNNVTAVSTAGSRAIAIVDAYHYANALADLQTYSQQFGLPIPTSATLQVVFASGRQPSSNSGWEIEEALDLQMAHAMAPKATLYLVEAASSSDTDLLAAVDKAAQLVSSVGGGEVSMSWGGSEFSGQTSYDSHFVKTNVVFFASTGDAPGVSWPSTSTNVVAVGGTSLSRQLNTLNFLHHASWVEGGGGVSSYVARPSYQSSIASTVGNARGVPDIAAVANPDTGVWVYDSGNGGWNIVGGTSVASPLVAGIVNASGHFYVSSAAELAAIYQTANTNAANYASAATGYCGPQASFAVAASWNLCIGVGSPKSLTTQ
jgi:subtilase family serine protease